MCPEKNFYMRQQRWQSGPLGSTQYNKFIRGKNQAFVLRGLRDPLSKLLRTNLSSSVNRSLGLSLLPLRAPVKFGLQIRTNPFALIALFPLPIDLLQHRGRDRILLFCTRAAWPDFRAEQNR
jgi:hypothetical protein